MHQESVHASDSEKTSSRFILDSLRHLNRHPAPTEPTTEPTKNASGPKKTAKAELKKPTSRESQQELPIDRSLDRPEEIEAKAEAGESKPKQTTEPKEVSPEEPLKKDPLPWTPPKLPAEKRYYRASEVGQLLTVEAHVLRYWQKEFSLIRPVKHGGTHWVYSRRDVEALHLVQHLLYREGLSIRQAKREIRERIKAIKQKVQHPTPLQAGARPPENPETLKGLIKEIKELIQVARNTPPF